jgi:hypothetical protein
VAEGFSDDDANTSHEESEDEYTREYERHKIEEPLCARANHSY